MAFSVSGKTAVVTGAGSGICYSFAKLLLERSCNVVLADLALRPEAETLLKDFNSAEPGRARAVFQKTDVTQWGQLDRAFEVATREFGGFDIVCPGAGVYEPVSTHVFPLDLNSTSFSLFVPMLNWGILAFSPSRISGTLQGRLGPRMTPWAVAMPA